MSSSRYIHVHVDEILKETEKAFLVRIDDEETWLPFSQISDVDDYKVGDKDLTLSISAWLANEKDLEGEDE
jgi:hypothetical protein